MATRIDIGDDECEVVLHEGAVDDSFGLFDALVDECAWTQHEITLYGRTNPVPRLEAWHGDPGAVYVYSGIRLDPEPWTPALVRLRAVVEELTDHRFNAVLCNRYRDGNDKVGWHADDEPSLGVDPVIASVSLGAPRRFRLRPKAGGDAIAVDLPDASVLVMRGRTQARFVHELTRTARPTGPRINLTYRYLP